MVLFNYALRELTAKIVYYGPGLSGKTTNLKHIHEELPITSKGRMLTLATETDRTLYFDFLPVEAGVVKGVKTRIQLYTVPGQVFYNATRRMVLKGADGVVFVADSHKSMMEANLESLDNLRENLSAHDLEIEDVPFVLQYNKRDQEDALPIEQMNEKLNKFNVPFYAAVATEGIGVEDTLKAISTLVLKSVTEKYAAAERIARPSTVQKEEVPASSKWLKENTDPFTAPQAVSAAAGAGGDVLATIDFDTESVTDPFAMSGSAGGPVAREPSGPGSARPSIGVEPDVKDGNDEKEQHDFDNLNLEGILDEALKVEEQEHSEEIDSLETVFEDEIGSSPREHPLSGALEDALRIDRGTGSTGPVGAQGPFVTSQEPGSDVLFGKEEISLLEDRFDALSASPNAPIRPSLDDLARTQLGPDLEDVLKLGTGAPPSKETTSPEVKFPHVVEIEARGDTTKPQQVTVPVHLNIDPNADDVEVRITLRVKIRRKKSS